MEWIAVMVAIALGVVWITSKLYLEGRSRQKREREFARRSVDEISTSRGSTSLEKASPLTLAEPHAPPASLDFTRLEDLLSQGKYEAADRETLRLLLRSAGTEQRGYLELDDWESLAGDRLRTLDRLWQTYSDGRFGLSVQRQFYLEADGEYSAVGTRAQWVSGGKWFDLDRANYTSDAPSGHLPFAVWQSVLDSFGFVGLALCMEVLFDREDWHRSQSPIDRGDRR
ncbi:GUN4 domain-containing protein [Baaleninema simplex]|uniref:GUN4 domain-containing protein n=1 Tax=Baaleninema simplex TaxID=2862350 RepID=UPI00034AE063|nr:GUN4 domain-containing protein [Baaleninema simplex]